MTLVVLIFLGGVQQQHPNDVQSAAAFRPDTCSSICIQTLIAGLSSLHATYYIAVPFLRNTGYGLCIQTSFSTARDAGLPQCRDRRHAV